MVKSESGNKTEPHPKRRKMKKLLYLVHRIPYPPNKGDKIRSFHFLKYLAQHYEVYLACFIDDRDDIQYIDAIKPYCKQSLFISLNPKLQKVKSLIGLLDHEALSLPYYRNPSLQAWVNTQIEDHKIELALVFSSPMAQYLEKHKSIRLIADFVDIDSDKWQQFALKKSWPENWIYRREAKLLFEFENKISGLFDHTVFVSAKEADLFKQFLPENAHRITYVNNGVDAAVFDPELNLSSPFLNHEQAIVFTGAMDYWPNVDAVVWFGQAVFPLLLALMPQLRFYIVGSKPTKSVIQLGLENPSIIVTGRVPDSRNYISHAVLIVAPLRIARGIQNKVLEAMAFAKPIVATSMAMEGIATENYQLDIGVADGAKEFASLCLNVLNSGMPSSRMNREFVKTEFSWQKSLQRLGDLMQ